MENKGFFARLSGGLAKTRANVAGLFTASEIDDDFYEELEEQLILCDMGVPTTEDIIESLKKAVKENHIKQTEACREVLCKLIAEKMSLSTDAYAYENQPCVCLVVGVNGVGKTTSIGKLAHIYKNQGKKVVIAAADTFRAAAVEQLAEWANRADVDIVCGREGQDCASVVYDALCAAKARKADILLVDTAGRLHNKKNLMDELAKINRIIDREYKDAHRETWLVIDAATGQNALIQAKEFQKAAEITGIIITKLDGTSKGGIAVAVKDELNVPVMFVGVGEKIEDLQKFEPDAYAHALVYVEE